MLDDMRAKTETSGWPGVVRLSSAEHKARLATLEKAMCAKLGASIPRTTVLEAGDLARKLVYLVGVDPAVGDRVPAEEGSQRERLRGLGGADDLDRRAGNVTGHASSAARDQRPHQHIRDLGLVVEQDPELGVRDGEDLGVGHDPRGVEGPLAGEQIELADERAQPVRLEAHPSAA